MLPLTGDGATQVVLSGPLLVALLVAAAAGVVSFFLWDEAALSEVALRLGADQPYAPGRQMKPHSQREGLAELFRSSEHACEN